MKSSKKIRYSHPHYGTVYVDGSFTPATGSLGPLMTEVTYSEMSDLRDFYRPANRIHKPMALLFWTDVVNGKQSRWPLPEPRPLPADLGHWAGMLGDLTSRVEGGRS